MSFSLSLNESRAVWDKLVAESPQGNVFCTTWFLDALGVQYELLTVRSGGEIQVGLVVVKKDGVPTQAPYPFTMYQGLLYSKPYASMAFHKKAKAELDLIAFLAEELAARYPRMSFCLHPTVEDIRGFQWFNYHEPARGLFRVDVRYTGLIDLGVFGTFDDYFQSIRSTRRNEYRRAAGAGLVIEESGDLDLLSRLHEMTFARQGLQSESGDLMCRIVKAALDKGAGRLVLCRDAGGAVVSATVFLFDGRCGYYFIGANDPQRRDSLGGVYTVLENLRWCKEKGLSLVDVVGINSPNRGDFKTSFNAQPVPYFVVTWERPSV